MLERIKNEPALLGGAVTAVLNALVLLDVVSLSVEQITGVNVALVTVDALFVRAKVTPTRKHARGTLAFDLVTRDRMPKSFLPPLHGGYRPGPPNGKGGGSSKT